MRQQNFEKLYSELVKYKEQFGHLKVPQRYIVDGYALGKTVSVVRCRAQFIPEEQKELLNEIGFIWKVHKKEHIYLSFEEVITILNQYKQTYGHLDVPSGYVMKNGVRLGSIVNNLRTGSRRTTESQKEILNSIGFLWKSANSHKFGKLYQSLLEYKLEYGNLNIKQNYISPDGVHLGRVASDIRLGKRKLTEEQREKLDRIGFVWKKNYEKQSFDFIYRMLQEYKEKFGNFDIPNRYVTNNGVRLGAIAYRIRRGIKKLSDEQKVQLTELGFVW